MKIIEPSFEILNLKSREEGIERLKEIEKAARTCYQSADKITEDSYIDKVRFLIDKSHDAMLEFGGMIAVRFITDRGISHELVRMRLCSFAQESTRYVKVDDMEVICPRDLRNSDGWPDNEQNTIFETTMKVCEKAYQELLALGYPLQIARCVLPTCLKTEINMSANIREWRHIFELRTSIKAHPDMRALMIPLLKEMQRLIPVAFDDIIV